jgi:hypothetical protein
VGDKKISATFATEDAESLHYWFYSFVDCEVYMHASRRERAKSDAEAVVADAALAAAAAGESVIGASIGAGSGVGAGVGAGADAGVGADIDTGIGMDALDAGDVVVSPKGTKSALALMLEKRMGGGATPASAPTPTTPTSSSHAAEGSANTVTGSSGGSAGEVSTAPTPVQLRHQHALEALSGVQFTTKSVTYPAGKNKHSCCSLV